MTQINLLPWREQRKALQKLRFGFMLATAITTAILLIIIWHIYIRALISSQDKHNTSLEAEMSQAQVHLNELNKMQQSAMAVQKELNFIFALRTMSYQAVRILDVIARAVPEAVRFEKLSRQGNKITIIGRANSDLEVTLFMKNLEAAHLFHQPELQEISAKELTSGEERIFQIIINQQD